MRGRYLAMRTLQLIPMIVAVVLINFMIVHLTPGDPASALAGENASPEYIEKMRVAYGLDKSLPEQFWIYLTRLAQGDLGQSYHYGTDVSSLILQRIPATLLLLAASQIPAVVIGIALGVLSIRYAGRFVDRIISGTSLALYSVPVFWTGIMLILFFSVYLGVLPSSGMESFIPKPGIHGVIDVLTHLLLPATALFLYALPAYVRLTRATMAGVMRENYILTARTIGFLPKRILGHYALRNGLLPTVTHLGMAVGFMFAGALLTETVFAWPGMGRLMYEAVFQRDYPVVMGVFLLTAVCVAIAGLLTDIVYTILDPRVTIDD